MYINDVDTTYNADLVASKLIYEVHNGSSPLRKYLSKIGISPGAFADIVELGLDAAKIRDLLFGRLRNSYVIKSDN